MLVGGRNASFLRPVAERPRPSFGGSYGRRCFYVRSSLPNRGVKRRPGGPGSIGQPRDRSQPGCACKRPAIGPCLSVTSSTNPAISYLELANLFVRLRLLSRRHCVTCPYSIRER